MGAGKGLRVWGGIGLWVGWGGREGRIGAMGEDGAS